MKRRYEGDDGHEHGVNVLVHSQLLLFGSIFDMSDILRHMLAFVGPNQYRFIGTINHQFRTEYLNLYQNKMTTCMNASTLGHAKICFEEIDINDTIYPSQLCQLAARNGDIPILQYLRSVDCYWDYRTCSSAAKHGQLATLKWANENGCPWTADTCARAAENGHIDIVKWARRNVCPVDINTCEYAALGGHLAILTWARKTGCKWDEKHVVTPH